MRVARRHWDSVFVLGVFTLFVAAILTLVLFGSSIYQHTHRIIAAEYGDRLALSYIWSKVRNFDEVGRIYVGDFAGLEALVFETTYNGRLFTTHVYLYEGGVRLAMVLNEVFSDDTGH